MDNTNNRYAPAGNENEDVIDLLELLRELLKRWKLIIVVTLVTTMISVIYTLKFTTPMYSSTAIIYLQSEGGSATEILQNLQLGTQIAPDYEIFFKSRPVVENVIKAENLDVTVDDLNAQVSITNPTDTHMINITVTDSDPQRAADIANSYVKYGVEAVREVVVKEPYIVESAIPKYKKVSPSNTKNVMTGFLIGFVLSCGFILVKTLIDDRLNSNDKIERVLNYPVVATFRDDSSLRIGKEKKRIKKVSRK